MRISDWSSDVCSSDLLAALDIYEREGLLTRGAELASYWRDAIETLKDVAHVIDIRTIGLVAGIELGSRKGAVGARAYDVFVACFEKGLLIRVTGDIIALSPPLIVERAQIDTMVSALRDALARSEEHTSELQSLMRISYAVFCLKKQRHKPKT